LTKQTVLSLRKNVCWHALKSARYVELFFRVYVLNRTSVYLHSFVYVIDHLRTAIFILATTDSHRLGTVSNMHYGSLREARLSASSNNYCHLAI